MQIRNPRGKALEIQDGLQETNRQTYVTMKRSRAAARCEGGGLSPRDPCKQDATKTSTPRFLTSEHRQNVSGHYYNQSHSIITEKKPSSKAWSARQANIPSPEVTSASTYLYVRPVHGSHVHSLHEFSDCKWSKCCPGHRRPHSSQKGHMHRS